TNTYLIEGERGMLLFDTGWAGTFPQLCRELGELGIPVQKITHILISHFHPDHAGIAQEIADLGAVILAPELQRPFLHAADPIFAKEKNAAFVPIRDDQVRFFSLEESREVLWELGIRGQVFHTPGHSDDSISLWLDEGVLFVGDLNPLYELELHQGTTIGESWERLLRLKPKTVYYGHAKKAELEERPTSTEPGKAQQGNASAKDPSKVARPGNALSDSEKYALVSRMMKLIDKGYDIKKIQKKTHADEKFIENVMRMYLTHQNISVQGILDRIELRTMH
ncbi:MAG: MBL fold metallo-hydrolase, partial [Lachnospiraceae bacterium]|nr:MBL fold metallo-hydrolase [Lachnospiraceae bacterium]